MGSCTEPASTRVKKEKTGASGRSQTRMVRPFGSFLTVIRFSKDAMSWAAASADSRRSKATILATWRFIGPPRLDRPYQTNIAGGCTYWTDIQRRSFESTWRRGGCQTGSRGFVRVAGRLVGDVAYFASCGLSGTMRAVTTRLERMRDGFHN